MVGSLFTAFKSHPSLRTVSELLREERKAAVCGLNGSSAAFLAAALFTDFKTAVNQPLLAVLPDEESAEAFRGDIEEILGSGRVVFFPERDTSLYEHSESHFEVRSQRIETLDLLESGWNGVVVTTISAMHDPTAPPGMVSLVTLTLRKGQTIERDDVIRSLSAKGFHRKNTVASPGEMAVRGGIIDVFPFRGDMPFRIEFWGDEIESIRTFSSSTQLSVSHVDIVKILPPDEFITEAGLGAFETSRLTRIEEAEGVNLDRIRLAFDDGDRANGIEQYLHIVYGMNGSLCSHFSGRSIAFVVEPDICRETIAKKIEHAFTIWERQKNTDNDIPSPDAMYPPPDELMSCFERLHTLSVTDLKPYGPFIHFGILSSRQYQGNLNEVRKDISESYREGRACYVACDNTGQADRLKELLEEVEDCCTVGVARFSGGFTDKAAGTALFTDHEIFGRHRRRIRYRKFKEGFPIPDYRALTLGDFVVHVDYGVGQFMGLKRIAAGGVEKDCLLIRYRGDDKLYVPVEQLRRLKKFSAEEGVVPVVNRLGGSSWDKLKAKTKQSIQKMAEELLRLYAERKAFPGHTFKGDEHMLKAMEESFIYEETPDQARTWIEVRSDMESSYTMERLICGDVGFGKTEIAMKASFLAVLDNRQVAILVPTTILAEQHEETFMERFADFPVRVESISRFRSLKEQKDILDRLAAGKIDIIIGTHRLFSNDVHIKNLGLLIIDEEQRFGVRHKERIKKLARNIDILSMSATPIPRTLNLSLMGARDISFINTPPPDRLSVHTEVIPFNEKYIIEAVTREIDRDGQAFFVHNRVLSIESMASYLRRLMPNISFCVAHGQLPERELEKKMHDFYHKKYQVLVSSMIIENGLDIPSVNTIIINRADTFGLAQLYQLRGRVGRSNVRAFAYLLVPPKVPLSKTARQRLKTIEEFADLGNGFNIAMRDLELRGTGNILGTEQSGFIASIGFDLYCDLLNETIAELKGEMLKRPPEVAVHSKQDAYFPELYIPDPQERVLFYRRLAETLTPQDVKVLEEELIDRFGRPEGPVLNVIETTYIRHYSAIIGVTEVSVTQEDITLYIPEGLYMSREKVESMVKKSPVKLMFSFEKGMRVRFVPPPADSYPLTGAKKVLQALAD